MTEANEPLIVDIDLKESDLQRASFWFRLGAGLLGNYGRLPRRKVELRRVALSGQARQPVKMSRFLLTLVASAFCLRLAFSVQSRPRSPLKFDEFGVIPCEEERARVDNYGRALRETSNGLAVIIVYAGRNDTKTGEVSARLFGMRDRLRSESKVETSRIMILDGGIHDELVVQFWIVPLTARDSALLLINSDNAVKGVHLKSPRIEKWEDKCRSSH